MTRASRRRTPISFRPLRQKGEVRVLGAARQDLVADDQDAGGDRSPGRLAHRILAIACARRAFIGKPGALGQSGGRYGDECAALSGKSGVPTLQHSDAVAAIAGRLLSDYQGARGRAAASCTQDIRDDDAAKPSRSGLERERGCRAPARSRSTAPRLSRACAGPARWPPRRSTSSRPHVRAGVTTGELDRLCHDFIVDHDAIPAPLNYRGFPKSICTSVNHVVCHGIPGDRRLMDGDILNIDVTVILDGWHGDTSRMFFVGERIASRRAGWST